MSQRLKVRYLFDPLCGWCYGASGVVAKLAEQPDIDLVPMPAGLFAGEGARPMTPEFAAIAWINDERIGQISGQAFSEAYRSNVLMDTSARFDSGTATRALTAVALSAPAREMEALRSIQRARYVEGRDITSVATLSDILSNLALVEAAELLSAADQSVAAEAVRRTRNAQSLMRSLRARGVPNLIVSNDAAPRLLVSDILFGSFEDLLSALSGYGSPRPANLER